MHIKAGYGWLLSPWSVLLTSYCFSTLLSAADMPSNETVIAKVREILPSVPIETVRYDETVKQFEIYGAGKIFYINPELSLLTQGELILVENKTNYTRQRLDILDRVEWKKLPLEWAIQSKKGSGALKLAVFADPDCPYCQVLEKNLSTLDNVTLFIFLLPLPMHPQAPKMSHAIWCAENPGEAWTNYMLHKITPEIPNKHCQAPLEDIASLAKKLGIQATPTLVFENGKKIMGALSPSAIQEAALKITHKNGG